MILLFQAVVIPTIDVTLLTRVTGSPYFAMVMSGSAVVVVVMVAFRIFRAHVRKKYQTDASFRKVVMLVTVPKEAQEKGESGKQEKSVSEVQEDIAVMEAIFATIGGLTAQRGLKPWLLGRDDSVSFEMVANDGLVSFYIVAPHTLKDLMEQQIQAQFPHAQVEEVPDYNIFTPQGVIVGTKLKFKKRIIFPIISYKKLDHDPLNSITNALAKVDKNDGAAIQLVVRSAKREWRKPAVHIAQEVQKGKSLKEAMSGKNPFSGWGGSVVTGTPKEPEKEHKLSAMEEEMVKSLEEKAAQLGLDVTLRIVASASNTAKANTYVSSIVGAFAQYNSPQYGNSFVKSSESTKKLIEGFIFRQFSEKGRMVMTGEELSSLYHMPLSSTETPNIRWLMARKAPPPPGLPKEGLLIGSVEYRGVKTNVYLSQEDRMRHMYIIGKSGSGKSVYIAQLVKQDLEAGRGVCVIDPHGDLVEQCLGYVPKERADDVIVFDPSDIERPLGLNMLEAPNEEMKDFMVGEMIAIFYKLFGAEMIGPMFEHSMRNFMLTLMSDPDNPGTIAEIPRLVTDEEYQKQWIEKVTDPVVKSFWLNEMANTPASQKGEMFGYLTSKVGRFVENSMIRNIIGQQRSAFDFREIMDTQKIFMVNLSKGKIGDVNANLLGLIMVTKLQMAAMGRADMPEKDRKDFMLYIDEFQNFVTPSIATILSEARKYRLGLIIAHQYMAQLAPKGDTEVRDAVMGNVGTMMVGRVGIEDAEVMAKEFEPVFSAYDLVNVEKFTWNSKILVNNQSLRPFNIKGEVPAKWDPKRAKALIQLARLKYGRDRSIVEQEILDRSKLGA